MKIIFLLVSTLLFSAFVFDAPLYEWDNPGMFTIQNRTNRTIYIDNNFELNGGSEYTTCKGYITVSYYKDEIIKGEPR